MTDRNPYELAAYWDVDHESYDAYLDRLYREFQDLLLTPAMPWAPNGTCVRCRRHPEEAGRHQAFWHIVSSGRTERTLDPERCIRMHWIPSMIQDFNDSFPRAGTGGVTWWVSPSKRGQGTRYAIARPDYSYVVFVEERHRYALLITAFDVPHAHRRRKMRTEHDAYWKQQGPPTE